MADPVTFALVATAVASAGMSAAGGMAAKKQADVQADQEREAAKDRQDARLQRYRQLREEQRVATAASGLSLSGATYNARERYLEETAKIEAGSDSRQTAARVARIQAAGRNARTRGFVSAATSLIGAYGKSQSIGKED